LVKSRHYDSRKRKKKKEKTCFKHDGEIKKGEIEEVLYHMCFVVEEESATIRGVIERAPRFRSVGPFVDPVIVEVPKIESALVFYIHVVYDEARVYHVLNVVDVVHHDGQLQKAETLLEHTKNALDSLARRLAPAHHTRGMCERYGTYIHI